MQTIEFNRLNIEAGNRILDLGCGEGRHSIGAYTLHSAVDVIGVVLSHKDIMTATKRLDAFCEPDNTEKSFSLSLANGLALPFANDSFDRVICSEVLEHIPDYRGVLREIDRVLTSNGLLAISVPRTWPERLCWMLSKAYHSVEGGHIRIFNAKTLNNEVEAFGLRRYSRHWAHALHVPYWWLKCLFWEREKTYFVDTYHRLLVWDLMKKPFITQTLDKLLNPIMGKSVVMYYERKAST